MALTYDESFAPDNVSMNVDFGVPLTKESLDQQTAPLANANGSSGFSFQNALNAINGMFDAGAKVYTNVLQTIGATEALASEIKNAPAEQGTIAKKPAVSAPATSAPLIGLSQTQMFWIAAALGGVVLISFIRRK